ncbi:MAG: SURF1 family protein [Actinobacteria bacterium]|nr:SURF1 family protein [Actinomycetota bacterium]
MRLAQLHPTKLQKLLPQLLAFQQTSSRLDQKMNRNSVFVRWGSWILIGLLFGVACWFLAQWQFSRASEVHQRNQIVIQNFNRQPEPLQTLLQVDKPWQAELEYRQVTLSGHYIPAQSYLVRNRPFQGNPGFLQLVAFEMNNGQILFVERGWLPTGSKQDTPDYIPAVDSEPRTIILHLRRSEDKSSNQAPKGQLVNLNIPTAARNLPESKTYRQAYGRMVSESPGLASGINLGEPDLSEGNHFSYALQWIVFGLMAFAAVAWNINQDRRSRSGLAPKKFTALNRDKDAEEEDKIIG